MSSKLIDAACHDLAAHFLSTVKGATPMDEQELAEDIQSLCEDFCGAIAADDAGEEV